MKKKHHLMIGVFAASLALTATAEARVDKDLARGKSPVQAASAAFAKGENSVQISRAFSQAGVSRAVAAHSVATAPRFSDNRGRNVFDRGPGNDRGRPDFDRDDRGRPDVDRGRGYDLSRGIHGYKDFHNPGRALAQLIALLKLLAGWHGHHPGHPGGPSPC